MTGATALEAVRSVHASYQRALAYVTNAVLIMARSDVLGGSAYSLSLPGNPVRLRSADRISLSAELRCRTVRNANARRFIAEVIEYWFTLEDANEREILAYHWHRFGSSPVSYPHLHLGPGSEAGRVQLLKAHLPTGPILLQDVLRLAIVDFGVHPLRRDWATILESIAAEVTSGM